MAAEAERTRSPRPAARRLVLLGAPGAGKGTQAELLSGRLGVPAISTGEMLREAVRARSPLGKRAGEIMDRGELVDDDTMAGLVEERLRRADAAAGFILDGYPRNLGQAETLDRILSRLSLELDGVVQIEVPDEVLVQRVLGRGRSDDRREVINQRLEIYRRRTEPLIEHYRRKDLLVEIDGHQGIEQVANAVLESLEGAA